MHNAYAFDPPLGPHNTGSHGSKEGGGGPPKNVGRPMGKQKGEEKAFEFFGGKNKSRMPLTKRKECPWLAETRPRVTAPI